MKNDHGFTLIEVVLVVTIMALLTGVLAAGIDVGIRVSAHTEGTLRVSHDVELIADRFVEDAASAATVTTASGMCGTNPFLVLGQQDRGVSETVSYAVDRSNGGNRLVRSRCASSGTLVQVVSSTIGVANPVLSCTPNCSGRPSQIRLVVAFCARYPDGRCADDTMRSVEFTAAPRGGS